MSRIVCLGSRLVAADAAGPAVYDELCRAAPADVELIDAGTPGLALLNCLDGAGRAVLVDAVSGYGQPGEVVQLSAAAVRAAARTRAGHAAGVAEALCWVERICERPPQVALVGLELPADEAAIRRAARLALALAREA